MPLLPAGVCVCVCACVRACVRVCVCDTGRMRFKVPTSPAMAPRGISLRMADSTSQTGVYIFFSRRKKIQVLLTNPKRSGTKLTKLKCTLWIASRATRTSLTNPNRSGAKLTKLTKLNRGRSRTVPVFCGSRLLLQGRHCRGLVLCLSVCV